MPKLLIIDDDESVRKVLHFRLKNSYEIIESGSPEEALALALHEKPDAILLDLMMPQYSGFEVCQTLSTLSFTKNIPILVVSGESRANYKEFCESIGAKDFVQKPVDFEALDRKLKALINVSRNGKAGETRVRLKVMLKLRPLDDTGAPETVAATEGVGARSFLCGYQEATKEGALFEIYLASNGRQPAGKARVTRIEWAGTPGQQVEFSFLEKPKDWILR